jgi:hypothetical protein
MSILTANQFMRMFVHTPLEQQLQQSNEIERLMDIGVLVFDYSSEWASIFSSFVIPKKKGTIRFVTDFRTLKLFLKLRISPISYSKDWGYDPFNRRVYLCFSIELIYGLLSHQTRCWTLMLKSYEQFDSHGTWENKNTNA